MLEFLWYEFFIAGLGKASKKRLFYGQADRRGKCENFDPFFIEIRFFDTQNTFFLIVKGLNDAFFLPFSWLQIIIRRDRPLVNDHWVKITFFLYKIRFRANMFIILGRKISVFYDSPRPCFEKILTLMF